MTIRSFGVRLHRWFGLSAALFLVLAGLTGAVIAWDHELDAWLNPSLFQARGVGPSLSAGELAQRVEAADPRVRLRYMDLNAEPGKSLSVFVEPRIDPSSGTPFAVSYNQVFVDPSSGEILGRREHGRLSVSREHLLPFIYKLHYTLHLPATGGLDTGRFLMGLVSLAWVLDCAIAIWLSFPRLSAWRRSLSFRWREGGHRLNFDLHRSGGVCLFPVLGLLALSSVAMNLEHEVLRPVVSLFSTLAPAPFGEPGERVRAEGSTRLSLDEAIAIAAREGRSRAWTAAPGGVVAQPASERYSIGFFEPGGSHGDGGLGPPWLHLDARSGAVLGASVPGEGSAGDLLLQAMFPIHSGRIAGTPGRVAWTVLGLAIASLPVTGLLIWARKRRARIVSCKLRAPASAIR